MPISFICPHCGRHTDVAEKYAGLTGPCAGCGRPVAVPTMAEWNEQNQGQNAGRGAVGLAVGGLLAVVVCILAGAFLIPSLLRLQSQSELTIAEANLKSIAGAMESYHGRWGCFPPAITYGPDGVTPYHSWRVLLLPYLEQEALYTQYNFREPWNSANNSFVMRQMPAVFAAGAPDGSGKTTFVVVTGDRTMFPATTTTSHADALKGGGSTALVVESAFGPVQWTEPKDLAFDNMNFTVNDPNGQCISGAAPEGALVVMVDGSTQVLTDQANVQMLLLRDSAPFGGASVGVAALYTLPADVMRTFEPILFGDLANQRLDEDLHGGQEGNKLDRLDQGEQLFGGVMFKIEPAFLCLGAKEGTSSHLPERIDGIPVNKKCERLHFLHATGWKAPKDGTPIGHYEIHYADGTTEMQKIVYGVDVRDWWDSDGTAACGDGRMVWIGTNMAIQQQGNGVTQIRLFLSTWDNPRPEVAIESIDFVGYRATECAPFCVAISIDNPRDGAELSEEATDVDEAATDSSATPETTTETVEDAVEATESEVDAEVPEEVDAGDEQAVPAAAPAAPAGP